MFLILLGPPGSGKGTQAKLLSAQLDLIHLSTGDLLREAVRDNTEIGRKAKAYMDRGELVPDNLMVELIEDQIKNQNQKKGYLLDGFPRTLAQAEMLEKMLAQKNKKVEVAVKLSLSDEVLIKRLTGRVVCANCNTNFNIFYNSPREEGICDNCGGKLIRRDDDQEKVVRNRIDVYRRQSQPVEQYYQKQKKLVEVEADQEPEQLSAQIKQAVEQSSGPSGRK